jgi:hypothetical protein
MSLLFYIANGVMGGLVPIGKGRIRQERIGISINILHYNTVINIDRDIFYLIFHSPLRSKEHITNFRQGLRDVGNFLSSGSPRN